MVVIDTTVWIDYLRGTETPQTGWLEEHLSDQRLAITDLILCEVLQGTRTEKDFRSTLRELTKLEVHPMGGVDLAVAAASHYRLLRNRGRTIRRTVDCWIATFCILRGFALLHSDRDFDPFEDELGLAVIHPPASLLHEAKAGVSP